MITVFSRSGIEQLAGDDDGDENAVGQEGHEQPFSSFGG